MKKICSVLCLAVAFSLSACAEREVPSNAEAAPASPVWAAGADIEAFWMQYAESRGGLTWGESASYPEYQKVKEGDTLLIQVEQGPCLMEFFHNRWRRANDVRRWHPSVNDYGGCPYVFD